MQNEEPIGSDEPQNPQPLTGEIVEASQIETKMMENCPRSPLSQMRKHSL